MPSQTDLMILETYFQLIRSCPVQQHSDHRQHVAHSIHPSPSKQPSNPPPLSTPLSHPPPRSNPNRTQPSPPPPTLPVPRTPQQRPATSPPIPESARDGTRQHMPAGRPISDAAAIYTSVGPRSVITPREANSRLENLPVCGCDPFPKRWPREGGKESTVKRDCGFLGRRAPLGIAVRGAGAGGGNHSGRWLFYSTRIKTNPDHPPSVVRCASASQTLGTRSSRHIPSSAATTKPSRRE